MGAVNRVGQMSMAAGGVAGWGSAAAAGRD